MPDCDAITSDPILVHVAPHGYAAQDGSLVVAGVVSVTAVEGPGGVGAVARGSAAGGVRLTVTGTGFSAKQGDMSVALCEGVDGSGAATGCGVGTCDVIRSGGGSLECVTSAATGVAEEATLSLRVTRAGGGTGTVAAAAATYQLLTTAQSLTVESLSSATGSTLGGMKLCITGTNLGPSANGAAVAVSIGGAACATLAAESTPILLCCTTAPAAAATVAVVVHSEELGDAVAPGAVLDFTYAVPPAVSSIAPSVAHAGSLVTLTFDSLSAEDAPEISLGALACVPPAEGSRGTDATSGLPTVSCVVASGAPGVVALGVHIPSLGTAAVAPEVTFEYVVAITGVSPAKGSAGGGTLLTLSGAGFEHLAGGAADLVTIGGCPVRMGIDITND